MPTPAKPHLDWAGHRGKITKLYWKDRKELPEVMKIMEDKYNFVANEKAYKKHFKLWGLGKNLSTEHAKAMLGIARRRRHRENKNTAFKHYGKLVKPTKLRRFYKRYKREKCPNFSPDMRAATPPDVAYGTPEPDSSNYYALPPAVLGCPDQEATSEGEQTSVGDSTGSYCFGGDGSPQASTIPGEVSPEPFSGLGGGPYPGAEQTNMAAEFPQNTFSGHQQSYALGSFSQPNASSAFGSQPWVGPTEPPSHPYQGPAYGTPWASHPQPPQQPQPLQLAMHSLNLGSTALAFPNNLSTPVGYRVIDNARFDNAIPSQTTIGISQAGSGGLEYLPLHSAVTGNDINSARALLHNGVNPNGAARGGVTPLHCAAYRKNVDMVKLLISYGANLEATTDKDQSVLFFAVCGQGQLGSSDMIYGTPTTTESGPHTDESTSRTIDALFECPTRWVHLRSSLDKPDKDGVTPLMVAAGAGFQKTATKLLRRWAQPDLRDHANHTALKYAAMNSHRELVRLLLLADPAVSYKRDISHILKLASKNIAAGHLQAGGGQRNLRERRHGSGEMLIAEEIVRLCREMGHDVLDRLLMLARQRRKSGVVEFLRRAVTQLDSEGSRAAGA
ncbi:ankyrin repeat-containing domain protein [Chaetomium fimeti]|uniref:Ankyrin repeat-containing domain protein n=1 Tax=Chaetomium fimeti TaxID=1854472 RepID=A0AAE0LT93_9PEZI|nr:ankyrin repeat-containing domain protein [Chaetomium fimeti]